MKVGYAPYFFRVGIHPAACKQATAALEVEHLPMPPLLTVSLAQHLGKPARALVKPGDSLQAGQCIAEADGFISAPVHAPADGVVKAVISAPTLAGRPAPAVVIETSGDCRNQSKAGNFAEPIPQWREKPARELLERVGAAGVTGMGGAGFPTRVKLSPPAEKKINTLIINGAECEPYLTSDHRMMLERAADIVEGARVIRHILGRPRLVFAIEDNKPDAVQSMVKALGGGEAGEEVVVLHAQYPQGSEKQQIYAVTGRMTPAGGLPMDVGVVVDNVATAAAVGDAVCRGLPLTQRVVTVTGEGICRPANLLAPIGASLADLIAFCGGAKKSCRKLLAGGPMMGLAQFDDSAGVTKTTSGIVGLAAAQCVQFEPTACIGCGRCNAACPMQLLPSELAKAIEANDLAEAEKLNLTDCFECGCCSYECPARRPIVQHVRRAKAIVTLQRATGKGKGGS